MKKDELTFRGSCILRTELGLEETAKIISNKLFGDLPFIYGEHSIWEEMPSMYIDNVIFGMFIILGGEDGLYVLSVEPYAEYEKYLYFNQIAKERARIDLYVYNLLKFTLQDHPEIRVND